MTLLHELLAASASARPEHPAAIDTEGACTFGALDESSDRIAARLRRLGIERGDRVAVFMENGRSMAASIYGVLKAGAVVVTVSPGAKAPRLLFILKDSGARAIIASSGLKAVADQVRQILGDEREIPVLWDRDDAPTEHGSNQARPPSPGDPRLIDQDLAAIIYTSGSVGEPKGVMLTHRNLVNTSGAIASYLGNTPDDVVCSVLPLAFSYGLCQLLVSVRTGHTLLLERSFALPYDVLKRAGQWRATGLPGLPAIFARLQQMAPYEGLDLSSIRWMTNAAAPLPPAHMLRLLDLFPGVKFCSMYGQTECTRATYLDPALASRKPGSSGRAIPNCETYILDERGERVGPGVVGELVVRGANVMRGYWGRPDETARKLREGTIPGERVLHTGDLFRSDEDGDLWFVSRTDDVFKCRGEKVSPREIESVVHELPEISEAVVVGVDDPIDGRAIRLVIVARPGASISEVQVRRHCRDRLEAVLMPKYIDFVSELPRTDSGKVRRRDLAERGCVQGP